ncbi:MAG: ABC transporter permease [Clostridia bacterium]|nr:ABC transporter permease [Clostridia bacterium]
MRKKEKKNKAALFHIVKRGDHLDWRFALMVRAAAVILAMVVSGLVITLLVEKNPVEVYMSMFKGAFGTADRIWWLLQDIALLLGVSLAVSPAFKMKFWNIGAEGQVLVGGLATILVMVFLGGTMPGWLLIVVMVVASILAGVIWAVVPAFFKARWNTNETLFTLMMNYVAIQLVSYFLKAYVRDGSGVLPSMPQYGLPVIAGKAYLLNILIVAVLTIGMYIYLKYSKQGYEISVVGESENTAKYIGIDVKKVIIRTMMLSGAICGIVGLLIVGGTNHTINSTSAGGRGFTAIMVSWLAKFNPIVMVFTTFLIVFLQRGAGQISTDFGINASISDIITGIILFFIIGCEFFLQYRVIFNKSRKENV